VVASMRSGMVAGELPGAPRTIRELLFRSAKRFGARPAYRARVGKDYRGLTFAEFGVAVERFATGLIKLGLQPGDKVALVAENGLEWVIGWYGVACAGGVNVPIYGELAQHELNNIVRQSESRFAIVSASFVGKLDVRIVDRIIVASQAYHGNEEIPAIIDRLQSKGLTFEAVSEGVTPEEIELLRPPLRPGDLAAIIYTSGTTGDPKGVMLSHRNLAHEAVSGAITAGYVPSDRLLIVLPLHHAFPFAAGVIAPLAAGAEVVYDSDLRRIVQRMVEVKPSIFFGVPALFATMYRGILAKAESDGKLETFRKGEAISTQIKRRTGVNAGALIFRELHQKFGGNIRYLGTGGAAVPPEIVRKFSVLGFPMMQGWGLTEASPVVAGQTFNRRLFLFTDYFESLAGSVGPALAGDEIVCLDVPEKNIYVAMHGEGEFAVRGPNVMSGYYKNETATHEVKVGEWLRTGDIGRIDKNGNIFITGRAKSVIVLDSGEKVYPDELEEHFADTPLVRDVCIIGKRPVRLIGERKMQVAAVIYPDPMALQDRARDTGERLTPDLVRRLVQTEVDAVQRNLAPFKRISEVVLCDSPLPRTDLKKVRRGQIREHYPFDLERLLAGADDLI
jgi:long-chain acyl-CoA synthetase